VTPPVTLCPDPPGPPTTGGFIQRTTLRTTLRATWSVPLHQTGWSPKRAALDLWEVSKGIGVVIKISAYPFKYIWECCSIQLGASWLPSYCTPLVCISVVIELLVVCQHNTNQKPKTKTYTKKVFQTIWRVKGDCAEETKQA